ncbi:MAG: Zn-ribbon domain-containing OB-fold protein [Microthrixaceae bacterium]
MAQIPLVEYLSLEGEPHLVARECVDCGAHYFERRRSCASCGGHGENQFRDFDVPTEGEVRTFTIVAFAAPGVPVPFVAAVVDCGGTSVRANVINIDPEPEYVETGMKVRLATFSMGEDEEGTEAIGFGFEPVDPALRSATGSAA